MRRILTAASALVCLLALAAPASAGTRVARFEATLTGQQETNWALPFQLTGSNCYHEGAEEGRGSEQIHVHMPPRKVLASTFSAGSPVNLTMGTWHLFHPAKPVFGHETIARDEQITYYDRPGTCGIGGGPTTTDGPHDCGTRHGDPDVELTAPGTGRLGLLFDDRANELKGYSRCFIEYPGSARESSLQEIFGRLRGRDLFGHKRKIVVKASRHWHHAPLNAHDFTADTTARWTLTLTRVGGK